MHARKKAQRANAFISVFCAVVMALSLFMPYLAFAADGSGDGDATTDGSASSGTLFDEPLSEVPIVESDSDEIDDAALSEDDGSTLPEEDAAVDDADESADIAVTADDSWTVSFGTTSTVSVAKGSTLTEGQIPALPDYDYTISSGIASGKKVKAEFRGWCTSEAINDILRGRTTFAKTSNDLVVNKRWDRSIGNSSFVNQYTSINGDTSLLGLYTIDVYPVEIDAYSIIPYVEESYKSLVSTESLGFVPDGFVITEAMIKPVLDKAQSIAGSAWKWKGVINYSVLNSGSSASGEKSLPITVDSGEYDLRCVFVPAEGVSLNVTGGTGIIASGTIEGPNIPEDADIEVATSVVTSGAAFDDLNNALGDNRISDIFTITLLVDGEEVHDGFGTLTISMPIDPRYNGHTIIIYHRHQDGSITTSTAVARDGYVSFTVTDLSWFALQDGGVQASNRVGNDLLQTGDKTAVFAFIAVAPIAAGIACYSFLNGRARRRGQHAR